MMTGHEVGAALGVAAAHRGRRRPDHPRRAGRRHPDAFVAVAVLLLALLLPTALVPRRAAPRQPVTVTATVNNLGYTPCGYAALSPLNIPPWGIYPEK